MSLLVDVASGGVITGIPAKESEGRAILPVIGEGFEFAIEVKRV